MPFEITEVKEDESNLDNLYVALIQCFAVIFCGYLAGRIGLITQRETSGLNTFVGKFSLPSVIFISLCQTDLSSVNWLFICSVFIAKALIFFLVLTVSILVTKPTNYARAGLLSIFCTQTNDFAIGVPILDAVYGKTHPEFVSYLYLLAPISLIVLNPIAFVLMEIGKYNAIRAREGEPLSAVDGYNRLQLVKSVIGNIISNPIVFMTVLGIIGNFLFDHKPPLILQAVLNVFGSAFIGTALMLLGLRMVGRVHSLQGTAIFVPALLIVVKLLLTPVLMREMVGLLFFLRNVNSTELTDFATFAFLYGTLPSAPGVFVYATSYGIDIDLIASSMVVCTLASAPLMFITVKMIAAEIASNPQFVKELCTYELGLSIASIVAICITLLAFILNRKFKYPHRITYGVLIAHLFGCIGSALRDVDRTRAFLLLIAGDMSSYLWIACLAMAIMHIQSNDSQTLRACQPIYFMVPLLIPVSLMGTLMIGYYSSIDDTTLHTIGAAYKSAILFICTIGTAMFLIRFERKLRQNIRNRRMTDGAAIDTDLLTSVNNLYDYRAESALIVNEQEERRRPIDDDMCETRRQLLRHFIFLIISLASFFITLGMALWKMITSVPIPDGVHFELRFLELTFRRGQGVIMFVIFCLDNKTMLKPIVQRLMKFFYGGNTIELPAFDCLPFETRFLCDKFVTTHILNCKVDIEKTKWCSILYGRCFSGCELTDWLIRNEVVENSEEAAVAYAGQLLYGRVIRHIYNTEFFHNDPCMLYTFITTPAS